MPSGAKPKSAGVFLVLVAEVVVRLGIDGQGRNLMHKQAEFLPLVSRVRVLDLQGILRFLWRSRRGCAACCRHKLPASNVIDQHSIQAIIPV